jgi:2-enoate reductase
LRRAVKLPFMSDFMKIGEYLKRRLSQLGVELRLGATADAAALRAISPDGVVVATGATPWAPPIPGLDGLPYDTVATFDAARLDGPALVIGGGIVGLGVALAAAWRGFPVDLVEVGSAWGAGGAAAFSSRLVEELKTMSSVTWRDRTTIERIGAGEIVFQKDGKRQTEALPRHIIVTREMRAETRLADQLAREFADLAIYRVGDCVRPRGMADAVFEGVAVVERL